MVNKNEVNTKERKLLSPKLDIVFQKLFGEVGSERITKEFLKTILNEEITEIDLSRNPILRRETINDKLGILDVIAKINGKEYCDIELQIVEQEMIIERVLYYWARLYTKQLKKGNDYDKLEKAIVILISDKKMKDFEELEYHTEWKIIETKNRKKILTEKLEIHIIELEKIENKENEKDELITWLSFLNNPESERVKEEMENNEALKEAKQKLNQMSEDEYMQRIAELREKAILDENTNKLVSYRKGKEEGKEEGKKIEKMEIAKTMLKKEISIELISEITGLEIEEIKKL